MLREQAFAILCDDLNPDLPFLAFSDFLAFSLAKNFLVFSSALCLFFPRELRVQRREKVLAIFGWFSLLVPQRTRKRRSGKIPHLKPGIRCFPHHVPWGDFSA